MFMSHNELLIQNFQTFPQGQPFSNGSNIYCLLFFYLDTWLNLFKDTTPCFIHSCLRMWSFFAEAPLLETLFFPPGSHNNFFPHQCDQSIYHSLLAHSSLPATLIYYWQGWVLKSLSWLHIIGRELWQRDTFVFFFFPPFFFIFLSWSTF